MGLVFWGMAGVILGARELGAWLLRLFSVFLPRLSPLLTHLLILLDPASMHSNDEDCWKTAAVMTQGRAVSTLVF